MTVNKYIERRAVLRSVGTVAAAGVLAGCGAPGGDDGDGGASPVDEGSPAEEETPMGEATATAEATPTEDGAATEEATATETTTESDGTDGNATDANATDGNATSGNVSDENGTSGGVPEEVESYLSDANNYDGSVEDVTGQGEVTIDVGAGENGFAFGPAAVRVDAGTTVVWEWTGEGGNHNVVAQDETFRSGDPVSDAGTTFEYAFEESGVYNYFCEPHEAVGMKGSVVVE